MDVPVFGDIGIAGCQVVDYVLVHMCFLLFALVRLIALIEKLKGFLR